MLGRWTRRWADASTLELQAYYDRNEREARLVYDERAVWDAQLVASTALGGHSVEAGAGYRVTRDEFHTLNEPQLLSPQHRTTKIASAFMQDEVSLTANLLLTLGVKLEDNSYTGAEWSPNARLSWRASDRQFFWAAISRATRTPSRIERDFTIAGVVVPGQMGAEKLIAYEVGWRGRLTERFSGSATLFRHAYDDLRTNDLSPPGVLPIYVGNSMRAHTRGLEAWGDFQALPTWRISLGGSVLDKHVELKPGSLDIAQFEGAGTDPDYWVKLASHHELTDRLQLDVSLRRYGAVPTLAASGYVGTPAYTEAGLRLAWRATDSLEISVTGLNLLHDRHAEASETRRSEVPRSVRLGLRWAP